MDSWDYIICGGGTVGCVLASRLSIAGYKILLIEAGPIDYNDMIMSPAGAPLLHGTKYQYSYKTTPQPGLGDNFTVTHAGRLLSGSSAVNYGMWTRGHSADYDQWANIVGDERWGWKNMLPYFKKVERHYDENANPAIHGLDGPMTITAGKRDYPLRETMREAIEATGVEYNPDTNSGNPFGYGWFVENWKDGKRQPAGLAYNLDKVTVLPDTVVSRIDFDGNIATGVTLIDGSMFKAAKEVVVCCGALKTPQLLMLSGIGPKNHLEQHVIPCMVDLPVGEGYHDHPFIPIYWKLKNPEKGLALGSPLFNQLEYLHGNAVDWVMTISTPRDELVAAAETDGISPDDLYMSSPRANAEIIFYYAPINSGGYCFALPFDGTSIGTPVVLLLPTSRGRVTLTNKDPNSDPVVDPNYLATATDRAALRAAMRQALRVMETDAAREIVEGDAPPPGYSPLTSGSTDEELDERMKMMGCSMFQHAGTAAMGKVVDTQSRVFGVENLRVCDASILPMPIGGHYQSPMYAFGEAMADIILGKTLS